MTFGDAWNYCRLPTPISADENAFYSSLTNGIKCLGYSDHDTLNVWKNQAGMVQINDVENKSEKFAIS